ncbi:hypothetical protein KDL67_14695 [bacterium]|nr:hypothetical protein [bacterium]
MRRAALLVALLALSRSTDADCVSDGTTAAFSLRGRVVAGESFREAVGPRWLFVLEPEPAGWGIRLYEQGRDLSAITPPIRGASNPRDLLGWHFRNAANTGPNTGDVNAPQSPRRFRFATTLERLDALAPSRDPAAPGLTAPGEQDGAGELRILDFTLDSLEPGGRARFAAMDFELCLRWPAEAGYPAPEDREILGACGLDLGAFALDGVFPPYTLQGDLDGDGSFDTLAQVRRRSDGRRALALCRAGTWLDLIGLENDEDAALYPGFIDHLEAWRLVPREHGPFGYVDEPAWPRADGDVLVLERVEKEMVLLYWADGALHTQRVYRYVEP